MRLQGMITKSTRPSRVLAVTARGLTVYAGFYQGPDSEELWRCLAIAQAARVWDYKYRQECLTIAQSIIDRQRAKPPASRSLAKEGRDEG